MKVILSIGAEFLLDMDEGVGEHEHRKPVNLAKLFHRSDLIRIGALGSTKDEAPAGRVEASPFSIRGRLRFLHSSFPISLNSQHETQVRGSKQKTTKSGCGNPLP